MPMADAPADPARFYAREGAAAGEREAPLQRRGLSRPLRVWPEHGDLPRGRVVSLRIHPGHRRNPGDAYQKRRARPSADAPARSAAAEALRAGATPPTR